MWLSPFEIPLQELRERLPELLEQSPPLHTIQIAASDAPENALTIFYKGWGYVILLVPRDVARKEAFGIFVKAYQGLLSDEQESGAAYDFGASDAEPADIIRDGVAAAYGPESKIRVSGPPSFVSTSVVYRPDTDG